MSRTNKKAGIRILTPQESSYTLRPWSCNHYPSFSEIEAYLPITCQSEIIADIHDTAGVDAEVVAGLIARAVNNHEKSHHMIAEMARAIELCLECTDGLTWEAEHDAQAIVKRAREIG
jgi:hypothetical protein